MGLAEDARKGIPKDIPEQEEEGEDTNQGHANGGSDGDSMLSTLFLTLLLLDAAHGEVSEVRRQASWLLGGKSLH